MQIRSLLIYVFWIAVWLPGSAMSDPGHGKWASGILHQVYDHPHLFWLVLAALIFMLGVAGWVLRKASGR